MKQPRFSHYGWVIVGNGLLVMFACLGLARFSFGVLLPPMAQALDLSYSQRGYLGTGYFIGYLLMVGLAPAMARRFGLRVSIALGLALVASSMGLLALAGSYGAALACYTVTGIGSGAANIPMMALIANWFAPSLRGLATGSVIAGNGVGIVVSGLLVPAVNQAGGANGWRWGWGVLAGIVALALVTATMFLRDKPEDKGLAMAGEFGRRVAPPAGAKGFNAQERRLLLLLGIIYLIFGLTYIIYGTFFVTALIDEHGMGEALAGRFWSVVGLFSLFSGPLFGLISDRFSRKTGLMATFAVQTAAYALASLSMGPLPIYASVALYGLAAWAIPTIMAATIADRLGPGRVALAFSIVTFFFAVGQVAGPTVAGWVADITGSFSPSFAASAVLTGLAVLLAGTLRRAGAPTRTKSA